MPAFPVEGQTEKDARVDLSDRTLRFVDPPLDPYPRPQVTSDQGQPSRIADPASHAGHQDIVLDMVEAFRPVPIHGDVLPLSDIALSLPQGSVGGASRSETEARFGASRIEARCHDWRDGRRDQAIPHRGDPPPSFAPVGLWDRYPLHRWADSPSRGCPCRQGPARPHSVGSGRGRTGPNPSGSNALCTADDPPDLSPL
jgi:hypothetical protein